MGLNSGAQTSLLALLLNNTAFANIGNAGGLAGSSGAGSPGNLYVSLYQTALPSGDDPTVNEATYSGYARVAVARTSGGWTIVGNSASNTAAITFPTSGGTTNSIMGFGICTVSSGAGSGTTLLGVGSVTPVSVTTGITPSFAAGTLTITD